MSRKFSEPRASVFFTKDNILGQKFSKFYRRCPRVWGTFHLVNTKASSDPNKVICSRFWSDVKPENRLSRERVIWPYLPNQLTKIIQIFMVSSSLSYLQLSYCTSFHLSNLNRSKNSVCTDCSKLTVLQRIDLSSKSSS